MSELQYNIKYPNMCLISLKGEKEARKKFWIIRWPEIPKT